MPGPSYAYQIIYSYDVQHKIEVHGSDAVGAMMKKWKEVRGSNTNVCNATYRKRYRCTRAEAVVGVHPPPLNKRNFALRWRRPGTRFHQKK
jgi:hypothetical protein